MEIKHIKNTFPIKIEGKLYVLFESYILKGSGYTFAIYKSLKCNQRRPNYFNIGSSYRKIVIIGNKYNYILDRNNNDFVFEKTKYSKNILKIYEENLDVIISLNDDIFLRSYGNDNITHALVEKEINLRKIAERKEKLIKINA